MSYRDADLRMLNELINDHADELTDVETEAFAGMRFGLQLQFHELTDRQRTWVTSVYERIVPQYANLVSRGLVPRGREVPTPAVLQNLPKKPPPKRKDDE